MEWATKAVILAANNSAAMKSKKPVALHKIMDKTVLGCMVEALKKAGVCGVCVVSSGGDGEIEKIAKNENLTCVVQEESKSPVVPESFLKDCDQLLVLGCDMPLICLEGLAAMVDEHKKCGKTLSCVMPPQTAEGLHVPESPTNQPLIYCFDVCKLSSFVKNNFDTANLFYEAYEMLSKSEEGVSYYKFKDASALYQIKNRMDLVAATGMLCRHIANNHIHNGVTVIQPETTYIGSEVEIGVDAVIYPGVSLEGKTKIGENCVIGYNSRIVNSTILHDTEIYYSTVLDSTIGSETHVGPYAYVRPNSNIGNNVKIGDFVEIKNAVIGNNTKVSHLTYVGDADVGEHVNFGCGTVTVNYDGEEKHRTVIGDKAFIGCNTNLVSPVEVGANAYTAAGSTITEYVPENSLAIARCHQTIKPEWRIKRKSVKKED